MEGGRKLNLNVSNFNDFEPGSKINYEIGKHFAFEATAPKKAPITEPNALNQGNKINQPSVTHVYLRKQGKSNQDVDNA